MFFEDVSATDELFKRLNLDRASLQDPDQLDAQFELLVNIPGSAAQLPPFSKFILDCFENRGAAWLVPTAWGIWPSSEDWALYYTVRRADGDHHELWQRPGHKFLAGERERARSYAFLFFSFGLDFFIVSDVPGEVAFASHDGWIKIRNNQIDKIRKTIEES